MWITNADEVDVADPKNPQRKSNQIKISGAQYDRIQAIIDNVKSGQWVIGKPQASEVYTVEQLIDLGFVGVYLAQED